jgi:transposase InsO family protein
VLFDKICRRNGIVHRLTAPRSPTTTGKIERFHQTLQGELLDDAPPFASLLEAQAALDDWVRDYNASRPHQALETSRPVTPAERFQPASGEQRELLPLWLPGSLSVVPAAASTPTAERALDAGAGQVVAGGPVEFDRVVPPSGNLWAMGRQFWLGPARAGQTVRFWADVDVIHLTINGARVKSLRSHLSTADLAQLARDGASPAGPPPLPPTEDGAAIEVDRAVNNNGLVSLCQGPTRFPTGGQLVPQGGSALDVEGSRRRLAQRRREAPSGARCRRALAVGGVGGAARARGQAGVTTWRASRRR